ncbi:MAG: DUF6491 family protein [Pseudomonadota bacterium]
MHTKTLQTILFCASAALICSLGACEISPEAQAEYKLDQTRFAAEIAAQKGEAVNRVCPNSNSDWRPLGDDALLLEARGDWYMLNLVGPCDPDSAFAGIATRSSMGSSCLSRGDDVITGRPRDGQRCVISGIFEWDEDTILEDADAASGS